MEPADRPLARLGVAVSAARSPRPDGEPTVRPAGDLLGTAVAAVRDALGREGSVGVVTADADAGRVRAALAEGRLDPAGPEAPG